MILSRATHAAANGSVLSFLRVTQQFHSWVSAQKNLKWGLEQILVPQSSQQHYCQ